MSTLGILFMIVICTVVWGGFLTLLVRMVTSERRKTLASEREGDPA